jgi:acyl-CoA thioesterase-1
MRFPKDVLRHAPAWAVILGGTNDLGSNVRPAAVMDNLIRLYELAQAAGVRPVAVTVPSIRVGGGPTPVATEGATGTHVPPTPTDRLPLEVRQWLNDHIERRLTLNRLIAGHCAAQRLSCLDLFTETAEAETLQLAARYSNDGLHLTTLGYERLAILLYERIFATAVATT